MGPEDRFNLSMPLLIRHSNYMHAYTSGLTASESEGTFEASFQLSLINICPGEQVAFDVRPTQQHALFIFKKDFALVILCKPLRLHQSKKQQVAYI